MMACQLGVKIWDEVRENRGEDVGDSATVEHIARKKEGIRIGACSYTIILY